MFSLFKKDKSKSFPVRDMVWKTAEVARKGMLMMAMRRLQENQPALLVTFFEDEKKKLCEFMKENSISFEELNAASSPDALESPSIYLCGHEELQSTVVSSLLTKNAARLARVVFFPCHYPIVTEENKILSILSTSGFTDFIFCLSFDDPMLESFKGNIVPLLEKLGLEENESIEHNMVTNALKNVRKKISEKVKTEKKAQSAEAWYALNMKP